jgi:hypothetical protein
MTKILKAVVTQGRYANETVRITNISHDEMGHKKAACILLDGRRANIDTDHLELISETPEKESTTRFAKTASMPFISGSSNSRTLTHTKNMQKNKLAVASLPVAQKVDLAKCEICGATYNREERKGLSGKITHCQNCSDENSD